MARIDSRLATVLTAVVNRIRSSVDGMGEGTCFLSVMPDAVADPTAGGFWVTVSPGGGSFDPAAMDGGGVEQATATASVYVRIHSPMQLDEPGHDAKFLTEETEGLLAKMHDVLVALTQHDLLNEPGGSEILREPMVPTGWDVPQRQKRGKHGWIGVEFSTTFDWDL